MAVKKRSVTVRLSEEEFEKLESLQAILSRYMGWKEVSITEAVTFAIVETQRVERMIIKEIENEGLYESDIGDDLDHDTDCGCVDCLPF